MRFFVLILLCSSVFASNLRTQEAEVKKDYSICNVCRALYSGMQNKVSNDGRLFTSTKEEEFKTYARKFCHIFVACYIMAVISLESLHSSK